MRKRDWSLVVFTIFAQASIGIVLCLTLLAYFSPGPGTTVKTGLGLENPVLLSLTLIGVATVVSFLHLGTPRNASKALNNLSASWLSREILALGVYVTCLLMVFVVAWKTRSTSLPGYLLVLASISGIVFLWMMIRIYMIRTIPPWNNWNTPLAFVSTTVCLGLLSALALHGLGALVVEQVLAHRLLAALGAILFTEVVAGFFHQSRLQKLDGGIDGPVFSQGTLHRIFLLRMALLMMALVALLFVTPNPVLETGIGGHLPLIPVLLLVVGQEVLGRFLFYSSYFRTGI